MKNHSTKLLELLTQNLPDMLWIKDVNGTYIYANKALCDGLLMAKDIDEPIGKNDIFFALRERQKHKDNPKWHTFGELCFNSDKVVMENNRPMRFEEYGNVRGEMLYLEVFKAPFYDDAGNILGTVGAGRDITELKTAQQNLENNLTIIENQRKELKLFSEKLEEQVLTEIAKRENQERLMLHQSRQAAMGEMLESIAHQWRQPLNIAGLAVANIETKLLVSDIKKEELLTKLDVIASNINYLSSTIDDFRNFLNPLQDKDNENFEPSQSIYEILKILSAQLKVNNIEVDFKKPQDKFTFAGIENEFKQVLIIILNNAIDAIKKRRQETKQEKRLVEIHLKRINNDGIVEISDNGGGIEVSIRDKIFEPYFTTKQKMHGTGIGLYIAKNIVESRFKGELRFKEINDGSCFSIKIPVVK